MVRPVRQGWAVIGTWASGADMSGDAVHRGGDHRRLQGQVEGADELVDGRDAGLLVEHRPQAGLVVGEFGAGLEVGAALLAGGGGLVAEQRDLDGDGEAAAHPGEGDDTVEDEVGTRHSSSSASWSSSALW